MHGRIASLEPSIHCTYAVRPGQGESNLAGPEKEEAWSQLVWIRVCLARMHEAYIRHQVESGPASWTRRVHMNLRFQWTDWDEYCRFGPCGTDLTGYGIPFAINF